MTGCAQLTTEYGVPFELRPLTAADRDRLAAAFERMSDRSRHDRFLGPKPQLSASELSFLTEIDHRAHEALVAVDPSDGAIVGVARYVTPHGEAGVADMALSVIDAWQGQGIGTLLARRLVESAAQNGIARLTAATFADNRRSRAIVRRLGFRTTWLGGDVIELECAL